VPPSPLKQQAAQVLGLLSRAQAVFGGDQEPAAPPESATAPQLEDNVGLGFFDGAHGPVAAGLPSEPNR
jgi:hypothetical protein